VPIYVYRCPKCGEQVEVAQMRIEMITPKCMDCDRIMEKQPTAASIQFKGSGWTPKGR
jgi:putative FmdB family regulatory protein